MKLRIYQNQAVPENPNLYVLSPTGDYGPFDHIECYNVDDPTRPIASFQAQFVKFGGIAYREKEYVEVLAQLGLVDLKPDTLNDMLLSDQTAVVIDKSPIETVIRDTTPVVAPVESPADNYATTTVAETPLPTEPLPQPIAPEQPVTPTPPVVDAPTAPIEPVVPVPETATTTPDLGTIDTGTASTTPSELPSQSPVVDTATSTPSTTATSTPE